MDINANLLKALFDHLVINLPEYRVYHSGNSTGFWQLFIAKPGVDGPPWSVCYSDQEYRLHKPDCGEAFATKISNPEDFNYFTKWVHAYVRDAHYDLEWERMTKHSPILEAVRQYLTCSLIEYECVVRFADVSTIHIMVCSTKNEFSWVVSLNDQELTIHSPAGYKICSIQISNPDCMQRISRSLSASMILYGVQCN